ncbi:MAG TPA: hypothetical protein VGC54_13160 [Planctomycetota bacterium]
MRARNGLLPLFLCLPFVAPGAGDPPETRGDQQSFPGTFVPAEHEVLELWPSAYAGGLMFLDVRAHGSYVNEGDVIALLDRESWEEQVHAAEFELHSSELRFENAVEEAELAGREAAQALQRAQTELARAERSLEGWSKFELKFSLRSAELQAAYAKHSIDDQVDELKQLEAMYSADELTDATEEIVLMRSRRSLASSRRSSELAEDQRAYREEFDLPERGARLEEAVAGQKLSLKHLRARQEMQARTRDDDLQRKEDALEKQAGKLQELIDDEGLFVFRAPRGGVLLHGAPEDYEPGRSAPRHERGGTAATRKVLFTVAAPDRFAVVLSVPESAVRGIAPNSAARVTADVLSERELVGPLSVERYPLPGSASGPENRYAARVQLGQPLAGVVAGMRATVHLGANDAAAEAVSKSGEAQ